MRRRWLAGVVMALAIGGVAAGGMAPGVRLEQEVRALGSRVSREIAWQGAARRVTIRARLTGPLREVGVAEQRIEIARADRGVVWALDPATRRYRELSFSQIQQRLAAGARGDAPNLRTYRAGEARVDVRPADGRRVIAGLACERLRAELAVPVTVVATSERATARFEFDAWVTRDPRLLEAIRAFDGPYEAATGTTATLAEVEALTGEWTDVFVVHMPALLRQVREHGYPLSLRMQVIWEFAPTRPGERPRRRSLGEVVTETRRVAFGPLPASEFQLPDGYTRQSEP